MILKPKTYFCFDLLIKICQILSPLIEYFNPKEDVMSINVSPIGYMNSVPNESIPENPEHKLSAEINPLSIFVDDLSKLPAENRLNYLLDSSADQLPTEDLDLLTDAVNDLIKESKKVQFDAYLEEALEYAKTHPLEEKPDVDALLEEAKSYIRT